MIPTSAKAEWHITYACDLECEACNRASFLAHPHTLQMTLDDAQEFFDQADDLDWHPRILLIGGEPALHPLFDSFVRMATAWSGTYVQVFSNGYTARTQKRLKMVNEAYAASICGETHKPQGTIRLSDNLPGWQPDMFVSPADYGMPLRSPCWQHSSQICGVSVDHEGYAPCAPGGALGALLGVGKTKQLADLFDEEKVRTLTAALCQHCGVGMMPRALVDGCKQIFGTPMSATWLQAFEGRS